MIRLALYLILYMIPAIILGCILLYIYPTISHFSLFVINIVVILGYFLRLRGKEQAALAAAAAPLYGKTDEKTDENAEVTYTKGMGFFLLIGTLAASGAIFSMNKTQFYIDNASDKDITVSVSNNGTFTIKTNECRELTVAIGKTEVEYKGKKKTFDLSTRGHWVWNVDSLNTYLRTNVEYSSSISLYKNPKDIPDEKVPNMDFIKKEFFEADVDYMFKAPKTIEVDRSLSGNDAVSKKILYRMNGDDFMGEDEEEDPVKIEKNSVMENKPKKSI